MFGAEQIREIPVWVGRESLLADLAADLMAVRRKVIVLLGQGGIGKTSLAVKLLEAVGVEVHRGELTGDCPFAGVIYVRVSGSTSFEGLMQSIVQGIELTLMEKMKPEQLIDAVLQRFQQKRYLLVLDNAEDLLQAGRAIIPEIGQFLGAMAERVHRSQLILTSREMVKDFADPRDPERLPNPISVRLVQLPGISTEESVALLQGYGLKDEESDLRWVAYRVGGHTLILTLLAKLARGKRGYLRKHPELVSRNAGPVLQEQLARQSAAGVELLKRMCVPRGAIGVSGLTVLRLCEGNELREPTVAEIEATEVILKQLADASLVQSRYDEERCEDLYDLHQVIVDFLRATYATELPDLMQRVQRFYQSGIGTTDPKILDDLQPILEAQYFAFQLGNYREAWSLLRWQLHTYLNRWGHWTLLQDLLEQILPHVAQSNRGLCLGLIGSIERDRGNWDAAERLYRQSLQLSEELGDRSGMASSWGVLGDIERNRGNWDEAEQLYRQCLQIEEELGDPLELGGANRSGMASSWGVLGDIERNRGNWDEAERLYRQSLQLREELGDRSGMASSWGVLGDIERKRGNWDEAERLYRQSLQLREELGDRSGMATSWGVLGDIERKRGNWDEAERLYRQSLQLREELGDRSGIAYSIGSLGEVELGRGNLALAEQYLKDAEQRFTALNAVAGVAEVNYRLMQLHRAKNNPTLAQQHYQTAHQLYSQLGAAKDLEKIEREWQEC